jgi:riboflavin synthase
MFSGIVEEVGRVLEIEDSGEGRWLKIEAASIAPQLTVGESVSVSGCCLTVVLSQDQWFKVEIAAETLRRTKLSLLRTGSEVNLERAMRLSDRLGGHLVSGHIDAIAKVGTITQEGFSKMVAFEMSARLAPFFIEKGSVAVDGVSLTVASCDPIRQSDYLHSSLDSLNFSFSVALIPHTLAVTTLGTMAVGDRVNIETDIIARYVARWLGSDSVEHPLLKSMPVLDGRLAACETKASGSLHPSD